MAKAKLYQIQDPSGGINKANPPTMLPDAFGPDCRNMRFRGGEMFKRLGYSTLGSNSITSTPMLIGSFPRWDGTTNVLCATTQTLYRWNGAGWSAIKAGLTGSATGHHSAAVMNDCWIYTNGSDAVQVWTGSGSATDLGGASDYGEATHKCRAVMAFADRVLLLGTYEGSGLIPQRVRWSELGKIDEYNENTGGGYHDLEEDPTGCYAGVQLGDYAYIYCGMSIWACIYVGGTVVYDFRRVVPSTGCKAPRTICDLGNAHIFMGEDDIYLFNGVSVQPIGEPIRDELFSATPPAHRLKAFAVLNRDETLYSLYVPYGGSTVTRAYIYNYQQNKWTIDSTSDLTAGGALELGAALTIDDLTGTIDTLSGTIDELGGYEGKRLRVVADSSGHIYQHDGFSINDANAAVDAWHQTKDFTFDDEFLDRYKRVLEIIVEGRGDSVVVDYSTDRGILWTNAGTLTLVDNYARYNIGVDVNCRMLRLRFRNSTSNERFWVRWYAFRYLVESTD